MAGLFPDRPCIFDGKDIIISKRYPHLHVYCSMIKIPKTQKQPKCSSVDKQIKQMCDMYIYKGAIFSHEEEGNPAICNNVNEPQGHYVKSEISQTENDKYYILSVI